MQRDDILKELKVYISRELLDGMSMGLDLTTPLLEWGVINSLEIIRLIKFVEREFGVEVPFEKIIPEHFENLSCISDLVLALVEEQSSREPECSDSIKAGL